MFSQKLGVKENENIELTIGETKFDFRVKIFKDLPDGIAGYPINMPGMPFIDLPSFYKLKKAVK